MSKSIRHRALGFGFNLPSCNYSHFKKSHSSQALKMFLLRCLVLSVVAARAAGQLCEYVVANGTAGTGECTSQAACDSGERRRASRVREWRAIIDFTFFFHFILFLIR